MGWSSATAGELVLGSSASSTIPVSFWRRRELDEDVMEPEAACRRQAEDRAPSVNSEDAANAKMVSCGENLSATDWNWTVVRADREIIELAVADSRLDTGSDRPRQWTIRADLIPCNRRDMPSGKYFRTTFLLRYCKKPYRGDFSWYPSTAARTSDTPPVPRLSNVTSSRDAYFRSNLVENID